MKKLLMLSMFVCLVFTGCSSKKTLADIKVNSLDSGIYSQSEWNQMLDEFVTEYNESLNSDDPKKLSIEEITYVGDSCLKAEIQDWYENDSKNKKDDEMDFMLLKLRLDKASLTDKLFNVNQSYPADFYYFVGKTKGGKWKILRAGLAEPGAYDLQCELKASNK